MLEASHPFSSCFVFVAEHVAALRENLNFITLKKAQEFKKQRELLVNIKLWIVTIHTCELFQAESQEQLFLPFLQEPTDLTYKENVNRLTLSKFR